jgi:hypothetical protein
MNVLTPYMVNANEWNWELKTAWFYAGIGKFASCACTETLRSVNTEVVIGLPFVIGMWLLIPETAG